MSLKTLNCELERRLSIKNEKEYGGVNYTARFGIPKLQPMRQYSTPIKRWLTDTKLQQVQVLYVIANGASMKDRMHTYPGNILWIGEVVEDLLVEDVKYYIQKIPARFDHKVTIKTTIQRIFFFFA